MFWIKVILLFQISLFLQMNFYGIGPEILFVTTLCLALINGVRIGFIVGFVAGGLQDILSLTSFNLVSFSIIGALAGLLRHFFYFQSLSSRLILVSLATLVLYSVRYFFVGSIDCWIGLIHYLFPLLIWNALLVFPLTWLFKRIDFSEVHQTDHTLATTHIYHQYRKRMRKNR